MEKTEFFSFKARRAPASFATMEGTASGPWPSTGNGNEKADRDSKRATRRMLVRIAPTLLSGMRTNTNCYVSCTGFRKGCYGLFRVYYVPLEQCRALSTAIGLGKPSNHAHTLERGKSQGSQATVKQ